MRSIMWQDSNVGKSFTTHLKNIETLSPYVQAYNTAYMIACLWGISDPNVLHVLISATFFCVSTPVDADPTLFPRQEIPQRSKQPEPSRLAQLLAEYSKLSANPYFEYGRFNGEVSTRAHCVKYTLVGTSVVAFSTCMPCMGHTYMYSVVIQNNACSRIPYSG